MAQFVEARLGTPVLGVERLGHGEWSRAFAARRREDELVVRFSATDADFRKDRWAMAFASADLPVPRILEIGEVRGGCYAISERAHGAFIDTLDEAGLRQLLPALWRTLDAARAVDLSGFGSGYGLWNGEAVAPYASWQAALLAVGDDPPSLRTHGWRERLRQSPVAVEACEAAYRRVQELVRFCPNQRHVVHSDLLNYNVLVADNRVSAVLDWGSALFGDFVWDVAWLTFWQPWYPAWRRVDVRASALEHYAALGLAVPHFQERLRCYELCIGMDGMAYQAFRGRWDDLRATAERVLAL